MVIQTTIWKFITIQDNTIFAIFSHFPKKLLFYLNTSIKTHIYITYTMHVCNLKGVLFIWHEIQARQDPCKAKIPKIDFFHFFPISSVSIIQTPKRHIYTYNMTCK